jgi:hypothetical protein
MLHQRTEKSGVDRADNKLQFRETERAAVSVLDIGCDQRSSRETEWGGAEMIVCCNSVLLDREVCSNEWAAVSSASEIRSRYRLQSRQRE